jgi:hypothetical protein
MMVSAVSSHYLKLFLIKTQKGKVFPITGREDP